MSRAFSQAPRREAGGAVLRNDAWRDPKAVTHLSAQPSRSLCQGQDGDGHQRHSPLHRVYPQKVEALSRILEVEATGGTIVFVRTKNETETVAEKLRARGFPAAAITGDMVQAQRERTIGNLKSGGLDVLVATDASPRAGWTSTGSATSSTTTSRSTPSPTSTGSGGPAGQVEVVMRSLSLTASAVACAPSNKQRGRR